jgi:hypothetical protein
VDGQERYDVFHEFTMGCSAPVAMICTSEVSDPGVFDHLIVASGNPCDAGPQRGATLSRYSLYFDEATVDITLSPPYYWQAPTRFCSSLSTDKRVAFCDFTFTGEVPYQQYVFYR